jgi:hypothetical protein
MKTTGVVLGLALAAALAVACSSSSSGPTVFAVSGECGPLPVTIATPLQLHGPCNLGPPGEFGLDAGLQIIIGQSCGPTPVGINADWIQGGSVIHSSFTGGAQLPCVPDGGTATDLTQTIPFSGTFIYLGGTGAFSDATGSATADGGVIPDFAAGGSLNASFLLSGSLTY